MARHATLTLLAAGLLLGAGLPAAAAADTPPEVRAELPDAGLRGHGTLRVFGLHIYDARAFSARPIEGDGAQQPLAIELRYARALAGEAIARRSIDEMRRVGPFSDAQAEHWLQAMARLFPDVRAGQRITGVHHPGQGARFFLDGRPLGRIDDPAFAQLFFGIWLSPRTSEPRLRSQLIGAAP